MKKITESELYKPIREILHSKFLNSFGNCHLEITASGVFGEDLQKAIRHDIIFTFLKRGASPDLAGFIEGEYGIKTFITVEIKLEKITIKDIAQAKLYGDLFDAKYAFLVSPQPIPEDIKRLHQKLYILHRFMSGYNTYIGELRLSSTKLATTVLQPVKEDWFPESPFATPDAEKTEIGTYLCTKCGETVIVDNYSDAPVPPCPNCGAYR